MEPVNKVTTVESLRIALQQLGLSTKGHKPELKQRYRKALKKQAKEESNDKEQEIEVEVEVETKSKQPFDYYLFFDVEATCEDKCGFSYPNEIIEFPVILVKSDSFEIVDEYRSYVKPTINSTLSDFCIKLTGITQSTVDQSPTFVEVLNDFQLFLAKYDLFQQSSAAFVTDGPFDIRDFITKQCLHSRIKRPAYFDIPWVNLRKTFKDFYHLKENKNINGMLTHLKMEFKGREHSGLDDARNLALIAQRMNQEGCVLETNCRFDKKLHQPYQKYRKRYVK